MHNINKSLLITRWVIIVDEIYYITFHDIIIGNLKVSDRLKQRWCFHLFLLELFLRHVRMLHVALRIAPNSLVHSNTVVNYVIAIRLFQTVLRNCLENFSSKKTFMQESRGALKSMYVSLPKAPKPHVNLRGVIHHFHKEFMCM